MAHSVFVSIKAALGPKLLLWVCEVLLVLSALGQTVDLSSFEHTTVSLHWAVDIRWSVGCDQVINLCREYDEMIADYEALTSDLLEWIRKTIEILNNRDFPNSLAGVQNMLSQFNSYRTLEKPPKLASFIYSQQHILFHRCKHLKELIGEIGHAH